MTAPLRPAVFLDRDGTLIEDAGYLSDPAGVRILPGSRESLARLRAAGFILVIVTNQSGIGRGYYSEAEFHAVNDSMLAHFDAATIAATYFCPDHPDQASERRKPSPGMLREAARDHALDLPRSYMIGDRRGDIEAGRAAGCAASILVRTGIGAKEESTAAANFVAADLAAAAEWIIARSSFRPTPPKTPAPV